MVPKSVFVADDFASTRFSVKREAIAVRILVSAVFLMLAWPVREGTPTWEWFSKSPFPRHLCFRTGETDRDTSARLQHLAPGLSIVLPTEQKFHRTSTWSSMRHFQCLFVAI